MDQGFNNASVNDFNVPNGTTFLGRKAVMDRVNQPDVEVYKSLKSPDEALLRFAKFCINRLRVFKMSTDEIVNIIESSWKLRYDSSAITGRELNMQMTRRFEDNGMNMFGRILLSEFISKEA